MKNKEVSWRLKRLILDSAAIVTGTVLMVLGLLKGVSLYRILSVSLFGVSLIDLVDRAIKKGKREIVERITNIVCLVLPFVLFGVSFIAWKVGKTTLLVGVTPIAITSLAPFWVVLKKMLVGKMSLKKVKKMNENQVKDNGKSRS